MTTMTNAYKPTSDLVHEQVALYEATDGREGGTLEGRWPRYAEFRVKAGDREIPVVVLEPTSGANAARGRVAGS